MPYPYRGVAYTATYMAINTSSGAGETGDSGNHTLRLDRDGSTVTPSNSPSEIDATNFPGVYRIALTAAEHTGDSFTLGGKSSTSNVVIVPTRWWPRIGYRGTANSGSGSTTLILNTGASTTDDDYNGWWAINLTAGGANLITDWVGSTLTATMHSAWDTTPSSSDEILLIPGGHDLVTNKTDLLTAGSTNIINSLVTAGQTIELHKGGSYDADTSNAIEFAIDGTVTDLTGFTPQIGFTKVTSNSGTDPLQKNGTVINAGTASQKLRFELATSDTSGLALSDVEDQTQFERPRYDNAYRYTISVDDTTLDSVVSHGWVIVKPKDSA